MAKRASESVRVSGCERGVSACGRDGEGVGVKGGTPISLSCALTCRQGAQQPQPAADVDLHDVVHSRQHVRPRQAGRERALGARRRRAQAKGGDGAHFFFVCPLHPRGRVHPHTCAQSTGGAGGRPLLAQQGEDARAMAGWCGDRARTGSPNLRCDRAPCSTAFTKKESTPHRLAPPRAAAFRSTVLSRTPASMSSRPVMPLGRPWIGVAATAGLGAAAGPAPPPKCWLGTGVGHHRLHRPPAEGRPGH